MYMYIYICYQRAESDVPRMRYNAAIAEVRTINQQQQTTTTTSSSPFFHQPGCFRAYRCTPVHPHRLCILPRSISRHSQHAALAPLSRGSSTLAPPPHSPAQHTRVAPRNNAAQVANATMNLFQETNEI